MHYRDRLHRKCYQSFHSDLSFKSYLPSDMETESWMNPLVPAFSWKYELAFKFHQEVTNYQGCLCSACSTVTNKSDYPSLSQGLFARFLPVTESFSSPLWQVLAHVETAFNCWVLTNMCHTLLSCANMYWRYGTMHKVILWWHAVFAS